MEQAEQPMLLQGVSKTILHNLTIDMIFYLIIYNRKHFRIKAENQEEFIMVIF
jgi:hypothetical protein